MQAVVHSAGDIVLNVSMKFLAIRRYRPTARKANRNGSTHANLSRARRDPFGWRGPPDRGPRRATFSDRPQLLCVGANALATHWAANQRLLLRRRNDDEEMRPDPPEKTRRQVETRGRSQRLWREEA